MKYTSLKTDISSIIHSSDNNFIIKFYDKDGNITLDENNAQWLYIEKENIMIEFPTDETSSITIWSSNSTLPQSFEKIIKRIRKLSVLNGVSLNTKLFNSLDRRKIYNIIKQSIIKKKEDDMNESFNMLSNILCETCILIRNTKKPSDFYISESMHTKNITTLLESYINVLNGISSLNNKRIKNLFKKIIVETSNDSIKTIIKAFKIKCPTEYKSLCENVNTIKNIGTFIKQRFLNNIETKPYKNVHMVLENTIVYIAKTKSDNDNLIKAYNHLMVLSEGIKRGIDLLRVIKNNKLCETYNVSKETLLDYWLSKDISTKEITPSKLIIFENTTGDVISVSEDMKPSINLLAECINNGGNEDDLTFNSIVDETIKFNTITNLLENHLYNFKLKDYVSVIKKIYEDSYSKIKSKKLTEDLFNDIEIPYDYSKELSLIESKLGFTHPSLKYVAIEESKRKFKEQVILENMTFTDKKILKDTLSKYTSFKNASDISESIIKNGINLIRPYKAKSELETCKKLLNNTYSVDLNSNNQLQECLYVFSTNPATFNNTKKQFVKTIEKYIKK